MVSRSCFQSLWEQGGLRFCQPSSSMLPFKPPPIVQIISSRLLFLQVIDGEGNVLPPGAEGDLAIRVKPIRPVGICSGYVVRNPCCSPSVSCEDPGLWEEWGGDPEVMYPQEALAGHGDKGCLVSKKGHFTKRKNYAFAAATLNPLLSSSLKSYLFLVSLFHHQQLFYAKKLTALELYIAAASQGQPCPSLGITPLLYAIDLLQSHAQHPTWTLHCIAGSIPIFRLWNIWNKWSSSLTGEAGEVRDLQDPSKPTTVEQSAGKTSNANLMTPRWLSNKLNDKCL